MAAPEENKNHILQVHDTLKPLTWLLGKWKSEKAEGNYPTIQSFNYAELIEFETFGQPIITYHSYTWNQTNNVPMHMDSGFLRISGDKLAFLIAHNFGFTSVEEGILSDKEINFFSTNITRMSFAKGPAIKKIQRKFVLSNDKLEQFIGMETSNTPMSPHLKVIYTKAPGEEPFKFLEKQIQGGENCQIRHIF